MFRTVSQGLTCGWRTCALSWYKSFECAVNRMFKIQELSVFFANYSIFGFPLTDVPVNSSINKRERGKDNLQFTGIPILMVKARVSEATKPLQGLLLPTDTHERRRILKRGQREKNKRKTVVSGVFRQVCAAVVVREGRADCYRRTELMRTWTTRHFLVNW